MKAQVTWKGEEGSDTKEVTWAGHTFTKGKAVELTDEKMIEKAQGNQYFEVKVTDKKSERDVEVIREQPAPSSGPPPHYPAPKPGEPVPKPLDDIPPPVAQVAKAPAPSAPPIPTSKK